MLIDKKELAKYTGCELSDAEILTLKSKLESFLSYPLDGVEQEREFVLYGYFDALPLPVMSRLDEVLIDGEKCNDYTAYLKYTKAEKVGDLINKIRFNGYTTHRRKVTIKGVYGFLKLPAEIYTALAAIHKDTAERLQSKQIEDYHVTYSRESKYKQNLEMLLDCYIYRMPVGVEHGRI